MAQAVLKAVIHGIVQGVGYRYFTLRQAQQLNLCGYVKNLPNGCVEVLATGDKASLERLINMMDQGPAGAYVTKIESEWLPEATQEYSDFKITYHR